MKGFVKPTFEELKSALEKLSESDAQDYLKRLEQDLKVNEAELRKSQNEFMRLESRFGVRKKMMGPMKAKAAYAFGSQLDNQCCRAAVLAILNNDAGLVADAENLSLGCNALLALGPVAYGLLAPVLDVLANMEFEAQIAVAKKMANCVKRRK